MKSFPHFPSRAVHCLDGLLGVRFFSEAIVDPEAFVPILCLDTTEIAVPGVFDSCPGILLKEALMLCPPGAAIAVS